MDTEGRIHTSTGILDNSDGYPVDFQNLTEPQIVIMDEENEDKKVIIAVFTISGTLAAFAGLVLASRMYSGQPSAGDGYEMDAIAACVLGGVSMSGGVGTIGGTIIGAIVIGIISNGLNLMGVSSFWQLIVKGIIILVAVIIDSQKKAINQKIGEMKKKNKANNG